MSLHSVTGSPPEDIMLFSEFSVTHQPSPPPSGMVPTFIINIISIPILLFFINSYIYIYIPLYSRTREGIRDKVWLAWAQLIGQSTGPGTSSRRFWPFFEFLYISGYVPVISIKLWEDGKNHTPTSKSKHFYLLLLNMKKIMIDEL